VHQWGLGSPVYMVKGEAFDVVVEAYVLQMTASLIMCVEIFR